MLRNEKKYSELVNSLNLFEDKDGISLSKGRITNSHLPYETRSPILLSKNPNFQNYPSLNATSRVLIKLFANAMQKFCKEDFIRLCPM